MSIARSDWSNRLHNAVINHAVADLVSAKQGIGQGNKRLPKNKDYDVVIASLQQFGVTISKNALYQQVVRAFKSNLPDKLQELSLSSSASSNVSTIATAAASTAESPAIITPTQTIT